uniref:HTH psq-type domain-containing protein n=1 Tax=Periophthalmus magnuspinnatus TaxID=409849 RepID=A0A3B3Z945_9GOBI
MKCSAPTKAPVPASKRPRKMLTIAEKVELLDMLREGRSYAAVGRHYRINESSILLTRIPSMKSALAFKEVNNELLLCHFKSPIYIIVSLNKR